MANKFFVACAVIALSANLAYAADGDTTAGASPMPLFKDPSSGMELVYVKGGCYQMGATYADKAEINDAGDPGEMPVHEVCVDSFYLGKYEVTQGQWKAVMGNNPASDSTCGKDNCPVDNVSWSDVLDFISKLNSKEAGSKYRLPTEAEWEYAARSGGKNERYSGGNDVDRVAWYDANSGYKAHPQDPPYAHPVGTKAPNGLGIYDMSGNMWEMTGDWLAGENYSKGPRNNPAGPGSGIARVKKGGCATGPSENQKVARRAGSYDPNHLLGFRLLRTP
jgi:formylglycine-generating enzyme required for sulfatase activity